MKLDKEIMRKALEKAREPSGSVTDAMAAAQRAAQRSNGNGLHGFRDMWKAGIDAALNELAA